MVVPVPGTCKDAGYPHKCIGNYDIDFWFKGTDCGVCTREDDTDGAPCPSKKPVVTMGPCPDPESCCRWFSSPSSKWTAGTCSQTADQDSCKLFNYEKGIKKILGEFSHIHCLVKTVLLSLVGRPECHRAEWRSRGGKAGRAVLVVNRVIEEIIVRFVSPLSE